MLLKELWATSPAPEMKQRLTSTSKSCSVELFSWLLFFHCFFLEQVSGTTEDTRRRMEEVRVQDKDYGTGHGGEKLVIKMEESQPEAVEDAMKAAERALGGEKGYGEVWAAANNPFERGGGSGGEVVSRSLSLSLHLHGGAHSHGRRRKPFLLPFLCRSLSRKLLSRSFWRKAAAVMEEGSQGVPWCCCHEWCRKKFN